MRVAFGGLVTALTLAATVFYTHRFSRVRMPPANLVDVSHRGTPAADSGRPSKGAILVA